MRYGNSCFAAGLSLVCGGSPAMADCQTETVCSVTGGSGADQFVVYRPFDSGLTQIRIAQCVSGAWIVQAACDTSSGGILNEHILVEAGDGSDLVVVVSGATSFTYMYQDCDGSQLPNGAEDWTTSPGDCTITIRGEGGNDILYTTGVSAPVTTRMELWGGLGDDVLGSGDHDWDKMVGGAGTDTLVDLRGGDNDVLYGDADCSSGPCDNTGAAIDCLVDLSGHSDFDCGPPNPPSPFQDLYRASSSGPTPANCEDDSGCNWSFAWNP